MDVSMVLNMQGDSLTEQADVSSKAVIKYKEPGLPVPFRQLKEDTNLNSPPENWLRSNLSGRFFEGGINKRNPVDLSSFQMAKNYLDHVGSVDVISDAENIKRLLKTPYSDSSLSMAVHRIRNTLLVSEFDIPKIISAASQNSDLSRRLEWLRRLYCEVAGVPQDSQFHKKKRNRENARAQNILSKFLHYSIEDPGSIGNIPADCSHVDFLEHAQSHASSAAVEMIKKEETFVSSLSDEGRGDFGSELSKFQDVLKRTDLSFLESERHFEKDAATIVLQINHLLSLSRNSKLVLYRNPDMLSRIEALEEVLLDLCQLKKHVVLIRYLYALLRLCRGYQSPFQRDILWTLDDITMLVGSDMPIFGGGRFPAVSLRLRDTTNPINILTGLDYWLDNLMCNVPELVMCYHLEGIVQKYEMVLTEDLPTLEGCRFSPKVVKSIAQDILSFLKSKCTKEGHTYWLFKDRKSDVVKLYDLTSICSEEHDGDSLNPFTIPVASLLYRIANNMIANGIHCRKDAVAACSLLQNCILLLEKENHPELMLAAHYLLAQLYMQDSFSAEDNMAQSSSFEEESYDEKYENDTEDFAQFLLDDEKIPENKSVAVKGDHLTNKGNALLDATREEKCRATIKFVVKALQLYDVIASGRRPRRMSPPYPKSDDSERESQETKTETNIAICRPMKIHETAGAQHAVENRICNNYGLDVLNNAPSNGLMSNLNISAIIAYSSLAEASIGKGKYGRALRFLKIALIAIDRIPSPKPESILRNHAKLGMMVGDICLIFAHKRTISHEDFVTLHEDDAEFIRFFKSNEQDGIDLGLTGRKDIDEIFRLSSEDLLIRAVSWYEESLNVSPVTDSDQENVEQVSAVTARLGNVRNELGVFYMNLASTLLKNYGDPTTEEQDLWKKSYRYFETGIRAFSVIQDKPNMALLHSNAARLMRLCAQAYGNSTRQTSEGDRGEFTKQERLYFSKAFEFYQKGMSCLGCKTNAAEIWNQISFDLSGAYFTMASLLQDYAPLRSVSFEEVSKEVQNLMMKSLHFCQDEENESSSPRYKDIRKRAGVIHHRIASLYQHAFRNKSLSIPSKKLKSLADLHYSKAYCYLDDERFVMEYLSTMTEHIALHTQTEAKSVSPFANIKRLKLSLMILLSKVNIKMLKKGALILESELQKQQDVIGLDVEIKGTSDPENTADACKEDRSNILADSHSKKKMDGSVFLTSFDCTMETVDKTVSLLNLLLSCILKDIVFAFTSNGTKNVSVEKLDLTEAKKMYEIYLRRSAASSQEGKSIRKSVSILSTVADVIEQIRLESSLSDLN